MSLDEPRYNVQQIWVQGDRWLCQSGAEPKTCGDCVYFVADDGVRPDSQNGCHRHPPVNVDGAWRYPPIDAEDIGCGEGIAKADGPMR